MKVTSSNISRRQFLKTAGITVAGTTALSTVPGVWGVRSTWARIPTVRFAYILSDHHAPLMVAAKKWEFFQEKYNSYLKPVAEGRLYDFYYEGGKLARVKLISTKKGPDVEKLIAQGSVDAAISGTQAILMSVDKGVNTHIVSPLQTAGNVFVVNRELEISRWADFVRYVKGSGRQFKIGMPGPHTVAAIIFRSALEYEGITYSEDISNKEADVLFINMKGHGNLVAALVNKITDGIIGAQPFPSVTIDRGVGRFIFDLEDVPPKSRWHGHACCSLEATEKFTTENRELAGKLMELMALGVKTTSEDKEVTAHACSEWLGVPVSVERIAMESLEYTTVPDESWKRSVHTYTEVMDAMGILSGKLKGLRGSAIDGKAFEFGLMEQALHNLKGKGIVV